MNDARLCHFLPSVRILALRIRSLRPRVTPPPRHDRHDTTATSLSHTSRTPDRAITLSDSIRESPLPPESSIGRDSEPVTHAILDRARSPESSSACSTSLAVGSESMNRA
jgi:hypothetical protein